MRVKDFVQQKYAELLKMAREGYAKEGPGFLMAREVAVLGGTRYEVKYGPKRDPSCPALSDRLEALVDSYDPETGFICVVMCLSGEMDVEVIGHGAAPWPVAPLRLQ